MATEATRRTPPPLITMELLAASAMRALQNADLSEANLICRRQLPPFFLQEGWLWQIRLDQIRTSPQDAPWLVRVAVLEPPGMVIGHAGFHGPPDPAGAVEIAYTVTPEHRGKGYAHALLAALVDEARTHPDVNLVRATISPDNDPSLAVVHHGGFVHVGEQWDDVDGLELVFEKQVQAERGSKEAFAAVSSTSDEVVLSVDEIHPSADRCEPSQTVSGESPVLSERPPHD